MLSKRQFVLALAITLAVVAAINVVLALLAHRTLPRRIMRRAADSPSAEVLAIGNSLMVAGFHESSFDSAAAVLPAHAAVNLGLGASTPVEQLLLFRYAIAHGMRPRLLLYGFYDFQLTDPVTMTNADLIGNRAILYYLEPEYARRFYSLPAHDVVEFEVMRFFPMFVERGAVWSKVEEFRRFLSQQGLPHERTNQFGRASDFSLLEAASSQEFAHHCDSALSAGLASPVEELLRQAHAAAIPVVVIEMPMSPFHRRAFYSSPSWPAYVSHLRSLLAPYDASFVDASDWITDGSLFADNLHLSASGGQEFSRRLGDLVRKDYSSQRIAATTNKKPRLMRSRL
ncbi:MAG TPA: hypothetical protein VLV88_08335 [Terriglobales bacterium]|nr:hypothetical protein [Terriglobales bacterium]